MERANQFTKLNENEVKVLIAVFDEIMDCTNGEFGYTDDLTVDGLTTNQIKGYLSQLVQKGRISIDDERQQVMMMNIDGFIIEEIENNDWKF